MSERKPALTEEEWADKGFGPFNDGARIDESGDLETKTCEPCIWREGERHGLAALCLHDQPFGFEAWMVDWLREPVWGNVPEELEAGFGEERDVYEYISERIAALLPPRSTP